MVQELLPGGPVPGSRLRAPVARVRGDECGSVPLFVPEFDRRTDTYWPCALARLATLVANYLTPGRLSLTI